MLVKRLFSVTITTLKIIFTLGLFFYFWQQLQILKTSKYFHEDEYVFVKRSGFFNLYFSQDFNNPAWQSYESYDVPKLGEYIYGATLYLDGHKDINKYLNETQFVGRNQENWWHQYAFINIKSLPINIQTRVAPILTARQAAVIFALGILISGFLLGLLIQGWLTGIIASILLYHNFLSQEIIVKAMGDSILVFFLMAHFLLTLRFIKRLSAKKISYFLMILISIVAGLAASTKLNGGLTTIYFGLLIAITLIFLPLPKQQKLRLFLGTLGGVIISFIVFCLVNPYVWSSPIAKSLFMIKSRQTVIHEQQISNPSWGLYSISDRLKAVSDKSFVNGANYANFRMKIPYFGSVTLDLWIMLAGFCLLGYKALFGARQVKKLYYLALLLWLLTMITSVLLLIPLDWDRYYYPFVISITIVQALLIGWGISWVMGLIKHRF